MARFTRGMAKSHMEIWQKAFDRRAKEMLMNDAQAHDEFTMPELHEIGRKYAVIWAKKAAEAHANMIGFASI